MDVILTLFIFVLVLFLYIHVVSQWKKSEDLEIYEMDYVSNAHLQEVCDIRQPVLFDFRAQCPEFFQKIPENSISAYGSFDLRLKDTDDYWKSDEPVDSIPISCHGFTNVSKIDTTSHYITEGNEEFLEETGLYNTYRTLDKYLKPDYAFFTKFDYLSGSPGSCAPLRYHTSTRKFLCVTSGKLSVKITPWKSRKYVSPIKDYENYEFRSQMNVWNIQPKFKEEFEKIRFLEFDVPVGSIFYIPAYWWYSLRYSDATIVCSVDYCSIMNCVAHLPDIATYYVQQQNITKKVSKPLPTVSEPPATTPSLSVGASVSNLTITPTHENEELLPTGVNLALQPNFSPLP